MDRVNVAIFLTAVGLIGIAPLLLVGFAVARRRTERSATDGSATRTAPQRSVLPIVAAITAALLIVGGGLAWMVSGPGASPPADGMTAMPDMASGANPVDRGGTSMPMMLADQPLTSYVEGPDAVADVARLHGSTFPMTDAEIAAYGYGAITIWRSGTTDPETAADQVERMRERIAGGGSPFEVPRPLRARPDIFATTGMGQRHFFFSSGTSVWWVSVMPGLGRSALAELLEGST